MRVEGILFGWFETGLEGTVWALQADDDPGYEGLFVIDDGDHLVITSPSDEILFSGYIVQDTEIGKIQRPFSPMVQPQAKGRWIHWTQKGYTPDDWAALFFSETNRAVLNKSTQPDKIRCNRFVGGYTYRVFDISFPGSNILLGCIVSFELLSR